MNIPQLPPTPEPEAEEPPSATVRFAVSPLPCQYDISLTEVEDPDGNKAVFMILGMSTVNGSQIYWVPAEALPQFSEEIRRAANAAIQKSMANNPIVVADKTQMDAALKNMNLTNRDLIKPPGPR